MSAITRAIKAIKFRKHVVENVEKFGKNMKQTFVNLFVCPAEGKSKIIRVLNLMQKNQVIHKKLGTPLQLIGFNHVLFKGSPALQKTPTKGSQQVDGAHLGGTNLVMSNEIRNEGSGSSVQRKSTSPSKKTFNFSTQKFIPVTDTAAFVDKSLFIKSFLEAGDDVIVVLAPSKFGKSTNMDMLKEFLSGNKELFEKKQLKIWKEEKTFFDENCQENPIIHVDFKSVGGKTEDGILRSMKIVLKNAYGDHQYLVNEDEKMWSKSHLKWKMGMTYEEFINYLRNTKALSREDVIVGFKYLSQCLYVYHGKPVYVLIDEYDAPIMKGIMRTNPGESILDESIDLIADIMSSLLKGNDYLKRGLINACLRITEAQSSGANNIQFYEFLREPSFVEYYGFTAQEVEDLFKREEFVPFRNDVAIEQWYDGYQVMDTVDSIYSCYSILKYLQTSIKKKERTFGNYWGGTGSITNMKALFAKSGIRELVEELINGEEIEIQTVDKMTKEHVQSLMALIHEKSNVVDIERAHLFIEFLADNGYLNVIKRKLESSVLTSIVKVPNEEIKTLLIRECYSIELLQMKYNLDPTKIYHFSEAIHSVLKERNENTFIRLANAVSDLFDKCNMPINADELHSILFTLMYNDKKYYTHSELSVERMRKPGRPPHLDIVVILGYVGMIIELKFVDKSSEKAHEQIEKKGYSAVFDQPAYKNVTKKILVGLHMDINKKVRITYTVDDTPKKSITSGGSEECEE